MEYGLDELDSGDGALLEVTFDGLPGICLCKEDFSRNRLGRLDVGKNAKVVKIESYGVDFFNAVCLDGQDADKSHPVCTLPRLTSSKTGNTIAMNMNRSRQAGIIYCQLKGDLKGCRIRAVTEEIGAEKENFMHLKNVDAYDVGSSGEGFVIQDKEFFRPAVVPVGTSALEFYLDSPSARIMEVTLWFVPSSK